MNAGFSGTCGPGTGDGGAALRMEDPLPGHFPVWLMTAPGSISFCLEATVSSSARLRIQTRSSMTCGRGTVRLGVRSIRRRPRPEPSAEGPSPRNGAAMAYDVLRERVVLFGGSGAPGETWEWDGHVWERIRSAETEGRFNSAMAYDARRDSLVRFGGWTKGQRVGDTWIYDGTRWTKVDQMGPKGRNHASMAFDDQREVVVLFGGHDGDRVFGDTWEWNGSAWSRRTERAPRLRVDNGH